MALSVTFPPKLEGALAVTTLTLARKVTEPADADWEMPAPVTTVLTNTVSADSSGYFNLLLATNGTFSSRASCFNAPLYCGSSVTKAIV